MRVTDAHKGILRNKAFPVKLDIFQDERGITIYGRFADSAIRHTISMQDCASMTNEALDYTLTYIILSIRRKLLGATSDFIPTKSS